MKRSDLPRGVFAKGRWYYLVRAVGPKRVWEQLSLIKDGLPALYAALAAAKREAAGLNTMPGLIAAWETAVMVAHAEKTQKDEKARGKEIARRLVKWTPGSIDTPACSDFLEKYKPTPRTFNAYRAQLRELMRFAEEKGLRPAGSNPLGAIRTMPTPPRDRYITDSELRRVKVAAIGRRESVMKPGTWLENESGRMLCALVDMAYLTGQAIGDLLTLEWRDLKPTGIYFARGKVEKTTGAKVTIEWTDKLRDVETRLKALRKQRSSFSVRVFTSDEGTPWTYWGASSAWQRARERAGVAGCTFHDIKAKALTDKERREGMQAARKMGQHSTEAQTADYVRRRRGESTGATR